MRARWIAVLVATPLAHLTPALAADSAATAFAAHATEFETEIARLAAVDERHPRTLASRLDFAAYLADNARGDCANRLSRAEQQLRLVEANPAAPVVLANAAARAGAVRYAIEYARAGCSTDSATRKAALGAAIEAAQRAAADYEALFDYDNLAVMRFDVANARYELGERAEGMRLLGEVIDFDRRYGLKSDAQENFRLLSRWRGHEASGKDVSGFLDSFPQRATTLSFHWTDFEADQARHVESWNLFGDRVANSVIDIQNELQVREEPSNLLLTTHIGTVTASSDADPQFRDVVERLMVVTARALAVPAAAELSKAGKFVRARDPDAIAAAAATALDAIVGSLGQPGAPELSGLRSLVDDSTRPIVTAEAVSTTAHEAYTLQTGMWIGSSLNQNEWREMTGSLAMFGTPKKIVETRLQVAFIRRLPCTEAGTGDACVELVIEESPVQPALVALARKLADQGLGDLDYSSMTRIRLVLDPDTLRIYREDRRRNAYYSMSRDGRRTTTIGAIRELTVTRYRPNP